MRVLHIGDLHLPFCHPKYLSFVKKQYKKWKCNKVVFAGDMYDYHAMSYHESWPDGLSAGDELRLTQKMVKPWYKAFPKAFITTGNHDAIPARKAVTYNIPKFLLKDQSEVYNTPKWKWVTEVVIDDVMYLHGKGYQ